MTGLSATASVYDASAASYVAQYDDWPPCAPGTDLVALATAGLGPGARVLDVGCGSGRDLARLRAGGMAGFGVDMSVGMLAYGVRRGPVAAGDAFALPFAAGSCDGVLAAASLLHLPDDELPAALAEVHRILRPGARLVVSVLEGRGSRVHRDGRFFQYHAPEGLDAAIASSGFTVLHAQADVDVRMDDLTWLIRVAVRS